MVGKLKEYAKEPLICFFLLGMIVFGLHELLARDASLQQDDPHRVEITSADIEWLRTRWNKLMGREPTGKELQGLVESLIREEILYREALAMGFDEKDTVVRRRLAQKVEFLFKDLAETQQPTDEQLMQYFAEHRQRYDVPARLTFSQVFFSSDKRGEKTQADAHEALLQLRQGNVSPSDAESIGDMSVLANYHEQNSVEQIGRTFGQAFAEQVPALAERQWSGPVKSSYGWHIVYVHQRSEPSAPDFDDVRAKVELDYMAARKTEVNNRAYEEISSKYQVLVEDLPYDLENK